MKPFLPLLLPTVKLTPPPVTVAGVTASVKMIEVLEATEAMTLSLLSTHFCNTSLPVEVALSVMRASPVGARPIAKLP